MAFIDVDLHTNSFTICRLPADQGEHLETVQLTAADLERFCLSLDGDDEIAVEATWRRQTAPGFAIIGVLVTGQ